MNVACRDIRPLLSAYMDSEITPDELRAVGAHVASCAECAAILAEYRQMRSLVRALPQPLPPPRLHQAVFAKATPTYRRRSLLFDLGQRGLAYGALTVAIVALILTASLIVRNSGVGTGVAGLDHTPPTIVNWNPIPGDPSSRLNQPVRITFSEPMDTGSVLAALQIGTNPADDTESARLVASARWDANTLVLGGQGSLQADTDYTISIDPATARDTAGNHLQGQTQGYKFRTANVIAAASPVVATSVAAPTASPEATPTPQPSPTAPVVAVAPTVPPTAAVAPTAAPKQPTPTATVRQNVPVAPPPTQAPAAAPSASPVQEPAPVATATPVPPTAAPPAPTETVAPPTIAPTATAPPSATPTVAPTAQPTVAPTVTTTPAPPSPTATPKLPYDIVGSFGQIYTRNSTVRDRLGLPSAAEAKVGGSYQLFEGGMMFWREDTGTIYVLFAGEPSIWYAFADGWTTGMEPGGGAGPAAGQFKPRNGFGKVWREQPDVQKRLGYALSADEIGTDLVVQPFEHGLMLWTTASGKPMISVLYQNGTYERYDEPTK